MPKLTPTNPYPRGTHITFLDPQGNHGTGPINGECILDPDTGELVAVPVYVAERLGRDGKPAHATTILVHVSTIVSAEIPS